MACTSSSALGGPFFFAEGGLTVLGDDEWSSGRNMGDGDLIKGIGYNNILSFLWKCGDGFLTPWRSK